MSVSFTTAPLAPGMVPGAQVLSEHLLNESVNE